MLNRLGGRRKKILRFGLASVAICLLLASYGCQNNRNSTSVSSEAAHSSSFDMETAGFDALLEQSLVDIAHEDFTSGKEKLEKALEKQPDDETVKAYLKQVDLLVEAKKLMADNQLEEASTKLNEVALVEQGHAKINEQASKMLATVSAKIAEHKPTIEVTEDGLTYVDGVLIANKTYALPSTYNPGVEPVAQAAFNEMQAAAEKEGIDLFILSSFRSYEYQVELYQQYVETSGQNEADRYSSRPGNSEHQTGLAFDLNSVEDDFKDTPEAAWIAEHAHEYGFIVRYPEGKEDATGYMYEAWHIRYLGKELADKVYQSGKSLEEYLGITSRYPD